MAQTPVGYGTEDRQWDIRVNIQTDEYRDEMLRAIKSVYDSGRLRYILIGGPEIGTRPTHSDYKIRHVHIAAIFANRISKASILKNFSIKEGNGYYLVPRNRNLPYAGWRDHHTKAFSKINPDQSVLYEAGELPKDVGANKATTRSTEEKKRKLDDILIDMRGLISQGQEEEAFNKFPRTFLQYGEKLKAMIHQKKDFANDTRNPHLWIYGFPGTGKTQILAYIYPEMYKKDLNNRYFDLYNDKIHTHIMLEDMDHQNVDKLGIQFIKTLCDEAGFPIDQKYKTPQLTRATILVSSNFHIDEIVPEGKGVDETKMALHRRFLQLRIDNFMRVLGVKLIPAWERKQLKEKGNQEPGAIFMSWDYMRDLPTGLPLETPELYQARIREAFYRL